MSTRKNKDQKRREKKRKRERAFGQYLATIPVRESGDEPVLILGPIPGVRKMSEVFAEFVDPFRPGDEKDGDYEKLLSVGVMAWNLAILNQPERDKHFQKTLAEAPPEARPYLIELMVPLIERKLAHFAADGRFILNFSLTPLRDGGSYLQVLHAIPPD
jgi:hypothetical protein